MSQQADGTPAPAATITRVMLRPLGSPLPLGFLAFALGTFVFSGLQVGWIAPSQGKQVAILMLAGVFPSQFLAAVMSFLSRDTHGASVLALLSASWLGLGLVLVTLPPGGTSPASGLYLIGLSAALLIFGAIGLLGKRLFGLALLLAVPRYLLIGIYELNGHVGVQRAAGVVGLVLAAVAAYGGIALLVEDTLHRTVLPVGRRRHARTSLEGTVEEQLDRLAREPGVRSQL